MFEFGWDQAEVTRPAQWLFFIVALISPVIGTVLDRGNQPARQPSSIISNDLQRDNSSIPADARDPNLVVPLRCDNARHMRAMSVAIRRVVITIGTH